MTPRTARRRLGATGLALALLAIGALGAAGATTGALFSDARTTEGNTVTAALVRLGATGDTADAGSVSRAFDVRPLAGADVASSAAVATMHVRSASTVPVDWFAYVSDWEVSAGAPEDTLTTMRTQLSSDGGLTWGPETSVADARSPVEAFSSTSPLAAGGTAPVRMRFWFPTTAGNAYQGVWVRFTFSVSAVQVGRPKELPIGLTATAVDGGRSTRVAWSAAPTTAAGVEYRLQRSSSADMSAAATVYEGADRRATDVGTGPARATWAATAVDGSRQGDGAYALVNGSVMRWGTFVQASGTSSTAAGMSGGTEEVTAWRGRVSQLAVGRNFACAVLTPAAGGGIECTGWNDSGQLGDGSRSLSTVPVAVRDAGRVLTGRTIVAIDAGETFACALASDGTVGCWGDNSLGQLGDGSTATSSPDVVRVRANAPGGADLVTARPVLLAAGSTHVCVAKDPAAVGAGAAVACWGSNWAGQLGGGIRTITDDAKSSVPVDVVDTDGVLRGVSAISAGHAVTCAVTDSRTTANVVCWGGGEVGVLGDGVAHKRQKPAAITSSRRGFTTVAVGGSVGCAAAGAVVQCWGANTAGQIGDTTPGAGLLTPRDVLDGGGVLGGRPVTALTAQRDSACALTASGALGCWGLGTKFQLGDASSTPASSSKPVAVRVPGASLDDATVSVTACDGTADVVAGNCTLQRSGSYFYRVQYRVDGGAWTGAAAGTARA